MKSDAKKAPKKKISDILFEAANTHLAVKPYSAGTTYTCIAIAEAEGWVDAWLSSDSYWADFSGRRNSPTLKFLASIDGKSLGEPFETFSDSVPSDVTDRQHARYIWLMFAYYVALDEEKAGRL